MKQKIIRESDMFGRVLTFWKVNNADIPAESKGATYIADLGSDQQKLVASGAVQKSIKVTAQSALIEALDLDLHNISITAHAIAQDVPGFDDLFALPEHRNPSDVLGTANAYLVQLAADADDNAATAAAKVARVKEFTDHAFPATFVADLQAQMVAIGSAKETHEESREKGVGSTTAIAALANDGRKQVNHLDALARIVYKSNPEQLRAWVSASHVEHGPVHKGFEPAPAPAPAPTGTGTAK